MSRAVDVYFSLISPWAHLGHAPLLDLAERHALTVRWKPVQLGRLFAETGGLPLAKRAPERQRYRFVELQRWAARRGRPLNVRPKHWPVAPDLADRTAIALIERGVDPAAFIGATFRAVWEDERDISEAATLRALLEAQGLDADPALDAATSDATAAVYDANRVAARAADVFGSPAYVLDGEVFWGQDRLDLLDEALSSGRPPYRPDR